jgi:hypothetical protein
MWTWEDRVKTIRGLRTGGRSAIDSTPWGYSFLQGALSLSLASQKLTTCTGQRRSRPQEQLLPVLPQINSSALHGIRSSSFQALAELINPRERRPGWHIMCDSPGVRRFGLHGALVPL